MLSQFYVYILKTLDGQIFYVGKGSGNRLYQHRYILERPHIKAYQRGVYKRMRAFIGNGGFVEEKIYTTSDETEALLYEKATIEHYDFHTLANTQSHAFTGRKLKSEVGRSISQSKKGVPVPLERRLRISKTLTGRTVVFTEERKQHISEGTKRAWAEGRHKTCLTAIEAMCRANHGKPRSIETKRKLSERRRARPAVFYRVITPDGTEYIENSYSLKQFCAQRNLVQSNLTRIARGYGKFHRGFTCNHVLI